MLGTCDTHLTAFLGALEDRLLIHGHISDDCRCRLEKGITIVVKRERAHERLKVGSGQAK
jgi:hypothetical protein